MEYSQVHSSFGPREVGSMTIPPDQVAQAFAALGEIGVVMDGRTVNEMARYGFGMDAITPSVTVGSVTTPVQFLQAWMPGFVHVITAARKIDNLVGIATIGSWEDEEVVQGIAEVLGTSQPYGDVTNVPLSNWNVNFERRSVVRFEEGMKVGILEEKRAAKIRFSSAEGKREGAALALDIRRNNIGFYGWNNGANRTYGFLNDPSLPAYVNVPAGAGGGTTWASKTFFEIIDDINAATASLRTQSGDLIDPNTAPITLAVGTSTVQYLNKPNQIAGMSVREWISKTYSNMRIESAPQLDAANGGANVFYLYAEKTDDNSTDGGQTFVQPVPAKFVVIGVAKDAKGYVEDYSNATAGVMCKRPWAVVRRSGI